jgi:hypothetical protein
MLFVLLFPIVKAIAQHVVNVSVLNIDTAQILDPTNTSFTLSMQGVVRTFSSLPHDLELICCYKVTHTGIIPAKITFTQPVNVSVTCPILHALFDRQIGLVESK